MATGTVQMPLNAAVANIDLRDIQLRTSADINTVRDGGIYLIWGGSNLPANSNGVLIVLESERQGNTYLKQFFIGVATTNPGVIWMRSTNGKNSAWQSWYKFEGTAS